MSRTEKMNNINLGLMIRKLRNAAGESQKELAEKMNKSESAVRMWELGKSEPDIETLKLLAIHFNVSADYMLSLDEGKGSNAALEGDITAQEMALIHAYRNQVAMRSAVNKLLCIEETEYVDIYVAARSETHISPGIERMPADEWQKIKTAEETDETLL